MNAFDALASNKPSRVLAIDDETRNLRLMDALLTPLGYKVDMAHNSDEAFERVSENVPDVILLDVMMPGMNGFEVCKKFKSDVSTAQVPILMITSLSDRDNRLKGIKAGANDFLAKPIDKEDLIFRVKNALYTKRLFDLVERHYRELKKDEQRKERTSGQILRDVSVPMGDAVRSMDALYKELEDRMTAKQKKRFGELMDTFWSVDFSLSAALGKE